MASWSGTHYVTRVENWYCHRFYHSCHASWANVMRRCHRFLQQFAEFQLRWRGGKARILSSVKSFYLNEYCLCSFFVCVMQQMVIPEARLNGTFHYIVGENLEKSLMFKNESKWWTKIFFVIFFSSKYFGQNNITNIRKKSMISKLWFFHFFHFFLFLFSENFTHCEV